ncbi:MAG TPA: hypothetical protein VFP68_08350 [Burkholderiaceae bacterium]|nr:hypothetical protein [Burkholderiaceae bacterium]
MDLLKHVAENKRLGLPLMHDMKKATGISEMAAWDWIKPDGTLKRKPRAISRLPGYTEWREELCNVLHRLGDPTELPGSLTTADLVKLVEARKEHPTTGVAALARLTGMDAISVHRVFDRELFAVRNDTLRTLPDYAEQWQALRKGLREIGHAQRAASLPKPETPAETFLRHLEEHLYLIRLVVCEMQGDATLCATTAARNVTASSVVKNLAEKLVGRGGTLRSVGQITAGVPDLDQEQIRKLRHLLRRIETKPSSHSMVTTMLKARLSRASRIFILHDSQEVGPSWKPKSLKTMYANNRQLVAEPRSFKRERETQVLRWLSTAIKDLFPTSREIQAYWDADERTIWLSSNLTPVNRKITTFFRNRSLLDALSDKAPANATPRTSRHRSKLREALLRVEAESDGREVPGGKMIVQSNSGRDTVLEALLRRRIRVPTSQVISDTTGAAILLHAERRIKKAFEEFHRETGRQIDIRFMTGVMRPCGICARDLGLPPQGHRGPFWLSNATSEGYSIDAVIQDNLEAGIGTTVSELREGTLSLYVNTDSESDSEGEVGEQRLGKRKLYDIEGMECDRDNAPAGAPRSDESWPIAPEDRDFIRAFARQSRLGPHQARGALREAVMAQAERFTNVAWHRDDAFADFDTMLEAIHREFGVDLARAIRVAGDLGDSLQDRVFRITVARRQTELQHLQAQAQQVTDFLRMQLGVPLPFEVPTGRHQIQQVLQTLLDEGSRRFKQFMRRMHRNGLSKPKEDDETVLPIAQRYAELRRASSLLGWLPTESSPTHALPDRDCPEGHVWHREQVERLFTPGRAVAALSSPDLGKETSYNICWFDSVAQLKLGKRRGEWSDRDRGLVEYLALRLRQASDALGMSQRDEMFEGDNGAMHMIARALELQIHIFRQLPHGAALTPLQSAGSPSDPAVYLWCDDTHYVPMWRRHRPPIERSPITSVNNRRRQKRPRL